MSKARRHDLAWTQANQRAYQHDTGELVLCEVSETDCPDPNAVALLIESWEVDGQGNKLAAAPARVVTVLIAAISQNGLDVDEILDQELDAAADRVVAHKRGMARLTGFPRKARPTHAAQRIAERRGE